MHKVNLFIKVSILICAGFLSACLPVVSPAPDASGIVNLKSKSITQNVQGVEIMVQLGDLEVAPYRMVDNLSSFYVRVKNHRKEVLNLSQDSYYLVDSEGVAVKPISPEKIQSIVQKDNQYLIPYPYVGYYYLQDKEKSSFFNTFDSSLPYYASNYPQDVYTSALPDESVLPGTAIEGHLYFVSDILSKKRFEIRVYMDKPSSETSADFLFPFSVEK